MTLPRPPYANRCTPRVTVKIFPGSVWLLKLPATRYKSLQRRHILYYTATSCQTYLDDAVGQRIGQGEHGGVDQVVPFSGEILVRPACASSNRRWFGVNGMAGLAASDASCVAVFLFTRETRSGYMRTRFIPGHPPPHNVGNTERVLGNTFLSSPLEHRPRYSIRNDGTDLYVDIFIFGAPLTLPRTH